MRNSVDSIILLLGTFLCLVAPSAHVHAAPAKPAAVPASPALPADPPFHVTALAAAKSPSYDLLLDHSGLAQANGGDIEVRAPDGRPVSHFIAYSDPLKARIIFDGSAGPGEYSIFFGNFSPDRTTFPEVALPGHGDWLPSGGFTVTNYAETLPLLKSQILGKNAARASFERAQASARGLQRMAELYGARNKFVSTLLLRGTDSDMGGNFYHDFRAEIDVPAAGEYEIQLGSGAELAMGILYLDGNPEPVIDGSFKTPDAMMVIATQVKLNLAAGPHVFEMFTVRRAADMRMRATRGGLLRYLSGLDAHFNNAARLTAGAIDSGALPLAEAYLTAIRTWVAQGRYAHARDLAQFARKRFPGDLDHDKLFAAEYDRAGQTAYDLNWLTEGKYPSRAGVVPDAAFYPPLRMSGTTSEASNWDVRHCSSAVSVEGKIVYGLPFQIMLSRPWGITSGVCVDDGVLFVGAKNGVMHAVYLSSGEEKWTFAGGGECLGPPLLYRGAVYYGGIDRRLYAVDAQRGRMLWNFPVGGWIEGGAAAADGRVFFGSRDGNLYAVDAAIGVERWHVSLGGAILSTPCVTAGRVFAGTRGGEFFAVDAQSGRVIWTYAAGAQILGGACATQTHVAFGDNSGRVHYLDAATGKLAWDKPAEVNGPVIAAPILVGDILFGGTDDGKLFGIDSANGVVGWEAPMPGGGSVARQPVFAADTLSFTSRGRNPLTPDGKTADFRGDTASFVMGPARTDLLWRRVVAGNPGAATMPDFWSQAPRLPGLLKPNGLSEGDGPADIRLAWDEKHLYVNATITAAAVTASADPQHLREGSAFTLLLDPARNGSSIFEFTVAPDGKKYFTMHEDAGPASAPAKPDRKNKPLADRFAAALNVFPANVTPALSRVIAAEKQRAWWPDWTADVQADGDVPTPGNSAPGGKVTWHVEMKIPLDSFPKTIPGKVGPLVTWHINVLLTNFSAGPAGKPMLRTWALCPPTAADPLGLVSHWPLSEFQK